MFNGSMKFIRRFSRENFYLSSLNFEIRWLTGGRNFGTNAKFPFDISKIMPAEPKKTHVVNTIIVSHFNSIDHRHNNI